MNGVAPQRAIERMKLFLDEIGGVPAETLIALLRVLRDHEFERIGRTRTVRVDLRFIDVTKRDLAFEVRSGGFRATSIAFPGLPV